LAEHIEILHPSIVEMLKTMENVFKGFGVDFYLVGAVARDIHLSKGDELAAKRRTKDVDLAIMINNEEQFYAIRAALMATGEFTPHEIEAIKLFYKEGIEVDLLPFGNIENEYREIRLQKPKLFIMDMPGFLEVFPFAELITVEKLTLNVCPLEGLVILKLIANDDRPGRTKDVTDIEHFIEVYFDLNADEIYSDYPDILDLYDTNLNNYLLLVSARIIGRKMKNLLMANQHLTERLKQIVGKRPTEEWQAMLDGMED
jgi:predicted nucleotidyltransferase